MAHLIFTYTDFQANIARQVVEKLQSKGTNCLHIGRRTKPLASPSLRGLNGFPEFSPPKPWPVLEDSVAFEDKYLSDYLYQMTRYTKGVAGRYHNLALFHEYRDDFHLTARKLAAFIRHHDIRSMLFFNIPHTGDDYLLYRVAEHLGVKVVLLYTSLFNNRFYSTASLEGFGDLNPKALESAAANEMDIDGFYDEIKGAVNHYMKGARGHKVRPKRRPIYSFSVVLGCFPRLLFSPKPYKIATLEIERLASALKSKRRTRREVGKGHKGATFLKWINGLEKNSETLPDDFVLFALHFQPEMTTAPQGGIYGDQALAVESLRRILPDETTIVVKENPLQGSFNRETSFTDRIHSIPNVIIAHPDMDSSHLIERAKAVATITGTIGWETVCSGKPSIVFGHTWYQSCPGVARFTGDTKIEEILKLKPSEETTNGFLRNLISASHEGTVYEFFLKEKDPKAINENAEKLIEPLCSLLDGSTETTFL